jgi:MFS family permease
MPRTAPPSSRPSPWPSNVRRFLAFRLLFNARFYYPVLAIFFVDLGLTLDQYALLNVVWAVSIVIFELPLGAVSDRIGRRPLIVAAGALMVVEMAVMGFAPAGNATLLFALFLVNRVLSGLAEAAASGADEALAYDTLLAAGRQDEWPDVLVRLQRISAAGFLTVTLVGAAVYDATFLNSILATVGIDAGLDASVTVRFPVYLTLLLAVGAFLTALGMKEPGAVAQGGKVGVRESLRQIREAGAWIWRTRFVLLIILFFLVLDSVVRLFLTLTSSYYRMIGIPAVFFGVLGAIFAAMGFVAPSLARALLRRLTPRDNFGVIAGLLLIALAGIATFRSWPGALFIVPLAVGFQLLGFFCSQYMNEATESSRRATVLSFKSLAGNLAYGAVGVGYALAFRIASSEEGAPGSAMEETVLGTTLVWLPIVLVALNVPLWLWGRRLPRMNTRDPVRPVDEVD